MKTISSILCLILFCFSCNNNKEYNREELNPSVDLLINKINFEENHVSISLHEDKLTIRSVPKKHTDTKNKKRIRKKRYKSTKEIISSFKPKTEIFKIYPFKDTLISCAKGTKIFFPANIIELPKTMGKDTSVLIEIEEYYTNSEFISKNLSTRSNNLLLETGGMFNIRVYMNGNELNLKYEESYVIYVPNKKKLDSMETFYGTFTDNGEINWINEDERIENDFALNDSIIDSTRYYKCFVEIPKFDSKGPDNRGRSWYLPGSNQFLWQYFIENFNADTNTQNLRSDYCDDDFEALMDIMVDDNGNFVNLVIDSTTNSGMNYQIANFLMNLPPIYVGEKMPNSMSVYCSINFSTKSKFYKPYFITHLKKQYEKYKDQGREKIEIEDIEYFVLASTKFGWINCDRLLGPRRQNLNLNIENKEMADIKIFMMMNNINGILNGIQVDSHDFTFRGVPLKSKIKIVTVGFLKGEPQMSILETTVGKNNIELSNFHPFSIELFDRAINGFN